MGKIIFNVVLPTMTKMFCNCPIEYTEDGYRVENSRITCPICRKEKGTFPILNKKTVDEAIALILALNGKVTQYTLFDRVRGEDGLYYGISQYSYPIGTDGFIFFDEKAREEENPEAKKNLESETSKAEKNLESETSKKIEIPIMRLKESEEEYGIPVLEIVSDSMEEKDNPYYIEEIEKILAALGMEEWEIIETDNLIETMESEKKISYLPDPDIPPVIISQWWTNQIAAKYPDLIHLEEEEVEEDDDF